MLQQYNLHVDDIVIGERHRTLSNDAVQRLAGSMGDIGLMQPISVRIVEEMEVDGELTAGVPVLVAGAHRLAAAKSLGWSHIDCIEVDDDALKAELWEIDENLMRAELTPAQQADHLARRKEIWEALQASGTNCSTKGFAADSAKAIGRTKQDINRHVARADALGTDIRLIAGTSLDKGVEMDALARLPEENRRPLIDAAVRGEKVSAREIVDVVDAYDVIANQADAIVRAWNRACPEARALAMEQIEGPVFDNTAAA